MSVNESYLLQTLSNGIDVIYAFEEEEHPLSIHDLAKKLNMNRTSLFRILYTLRHKGILDFDMETGKYQLSLKLVQLASLVLKRMGIKEVARPYLEEIKDKLNETVHLLALGDQHAIFIDKVTPAETMLMNSYIGMVAPLYCTASGKLFLSYQTEQYIENYLNTVPLKKFTDKTYTDREKLLENLRLIRQQGYSIDDEEIEEGLVGYAAPIFNRKGQVFASISVSGPASRMRRKKDEILPAIIEAAKIITQNYNSTLGSSVN